MNQYALLVGVGCFQNGLHSLSYVEDDLNDFCNVLVEHFKIDYDNIEYLPNSSATQAAIMDAVATLCEKAVKGDRVILYFATHGKTTYNTTYLSAYDALINNPDDTEGWIRVEKVLGDFHNAGLSILAFLDSCHSTQFCISRAINDPAAYNIPTDNSCGEYMAVFAAAGENENAYPDPTLGHGCWTYYLLEALSGRAPRAFSGNSSRITIHSLQSYLKEKVSTRVRDELHKTQTPHFWGTYSDDIVIVEHPITEGQRLKIKDIYFGEIDTDSEKLNAPSSEFMSKNFYDLNSICSRLNTNNGIQIIIGNKGTGKTYLGEYLESSSDQMIYQSLGTITLSDLQKLTSNQADVKGKYELAWSYILYTILACIIVRDEKAGADEFKDLLNNIYGDMVVAQIDSILHSFSRGRLKIINSKIKRGIALQDPFNHYSNDNGLTNIDGLILIYIDLFNKYYKSEKLYFLLDGLDEQLRGQLTEDNQKYLLDLLSTVNQSHQELDGIKIVLLFRNDILHSLPGEANTNKTITARSCTLNWLSTNTKYSETPLYQFLEKRIETSAVATGNGLTVKLSDILPPKMQSTDTWEWILKLTTYTPRDIVSFFNCCKEFAGDQHYLTVDNLWAAVRPYSNYLWDEFQDVLAGTALAGRSEQLLNLFNRLVQRHNLKANTRFSFSDFNGVFQETAGLTDISISDVLRTLYEAGMMCVRTNSGTFWYFREDPLDFNLDTWKESVFEIHTGLWKKLHIW